jgi:hypothetical protein
MTYIYVVRRQRVNWQVLCAAYQSMGALLFMEVPDAPQPYTVNILWLQQTAAQIHMSE